MEKQGGVCTKELILRSTVQQRGAPETPFVRSFLNTALGLWVHFCAPELHRAYTLPLPAALHDLPRAKCSSSLLAWCFIIAKKKSIKRMQPQPGFPQPKQRAAAAKAQAALGPKVCRVALTWHMNAHLSLACRWRGSWCSRRCLFRYWWRCAYRL